MRILCVNKDLRCDRAVKCVFEVFLKVILTSERAPETKKKEWRERESAFVPGDSRYIHIGIREQK